MTSAWDNLCGHAEQRALFARSLQTGRLSHAYVLCGPDGVGKHKFAKLLAQSLFCRNRHEGEVDACGECRACRGFEAGNWPDYHEVSLPAGKSEIPLALILGEKESRGREGLLFELASAPMASDRRIAVINDALHLNADGANALLKTLEEPPPQTLIMIICDSPESLLPTIRSRCQIIRFFPLTDADVVTILMREQLTEAHAEAEAVAAMAEGSLAVARQLLNPDLRKMRDRINGQLEQLEAMKPLDVSKSVIEALGQISTAADEQRRNAGWLLRFAAEFVSMRLRRLASGDFSDPIQKKYGIRNGVDLLSPVLDRLSRAANQIESNAPVPLIIEALFDDIARHFRAGPVSAR